jgi:hypothetical protein
MECAICQDAYNENENKPYLINPCGHCMCLKCLNRLLQQVCPHCRGKIESRTINRGILDFVYTFKSLSSLTKSPNLQTSASSVSLIEADSIQKEKFLNEINQLNSQLQATFKLKQNETKQLISQMRYEIKQKTDEKKNVLLMHSQDLINKIDQIEEEFAKMEKSSQTMFEKFDRETRLFEEKLKAVHTDENELNQAATKLKQNLDKKLNDFEKFELGIQFEPRNEDEKYNEENSIGYIVSRSSNGPRVSRLLNTK